MSRRALLEAPSRGLALLLDLALEPCGEVVEVRLGKDGVASRLYGLDDHMIVALVAVRRKIAYKPRNVTRLFLSCVSMNSPWKTSHESRYQSASLPISSRRPSSQSTMSGGRRRPSARTAPAGAASLVSGEAVRNHRPLRWGHET